MKKILFVISSSLYAAVSFGQNTAQKIEKAFQEFQADSQLSHAITSLFVIDASTGKVVFDRNSQVGLAPASTQKIITAATAFELLGRDYRYETKFRLKDKNVLYIEPGGDPSFGSWRWNNTSTAHILAELSGAIKKLNVKVFSKALIDYS